MQRWTDEHSARLAELWPTGATLTEIGKLLGFSVALISIRAAQMGLPPRRAPTAERIYLLAEADRRGLSTRELQARILHTIVKDRLVAAVLADEVAEADAEAAEAGNVAPACETEWLAKLQSVGEK